MSLFQLALSLTLAAHSVGNPTGDLRPLADALIDMWEGADLVCLGENHGSRLDAALRQALVKHPDFPDTVDQILVEFANPVHQDLLHRFILDGESMSGQELAPIWRDAGSGSTWESPHYEAFLRSVQDLNATLPPNRRIPVIGAATAIDWRHVENAADLLPLIDRQQEILETIRRHAFRGGRRTLAIFGAGHCEKTGMGFPARLNEAEKLRTWSAFSFANPQGAAEGRTQLGLDDTPRIVPIDGPELGNLPVGKMFFIGHEIAGTTLGELTDAVLSYGAVVDHIDLPNLDALSPAFRKELDRRARLRAEAMELQRLRSP